MDHKKLMSVRCWSLNRLDKGSTLPRRRGPKAARRCSVRGGLCLRLIPLTLAAAVSIIFIPPSKADMNLKLYAYNLMIWEEFQCFNWLIYKESRWNPKARNGSHYGLGQMRSTWYRDLSPQGQIRASIKYYAHRYGDSCKALDHFEHKGWS
jgi:hypothetical protein